MHSSNLLRIAGRYTFAFGKGYLSTFLSTLSMLGLVLAIALLIIVLSVMNGFDKEMRERILSLVPHVTIYFHEPLENWQEVAPVLLQHPDVIAVAPFTQFDSMLIRAGSIETARVIGLDTQDSDSVAELKSHMDPAQLQAFIEDSNGLILGSGIAKGLQITVGQRLTLLVPGQQAGEGATGAQSHTVTLRAIIDTATELDETAALVHLKLGAQLAGQQNSVSGLRLQTANIFEVSRIGWELVNNLPPGYYATNWMMTHGNLYAAIQLSRDLISILLFSIIAVAAFNVVSSLVLVVFDKRGDIAILRTLGISPAQVASIFVLQGAMIGIVGVVVGTCAGLAGSVLLPSFVNVLEQWLGTRFLNTDVYPVSFVPVDILARDIVFVGGVAFVMCILAAIYPALRAARLAPAAVLHQE